MQFLKAENTSSHRSLGTRTLQFNREIKLTNKNSAKINQKFTVRQKGGGGGDRTIAPALNTPLMIFLYPFVF